MIAPFPGDFAVHAILYRFGGQYLVIAAQIFVQFAVVAGLYLCARRLIGRNAALAAGFLMVVMPGALMNPHLLVTETWVAALISLGILFFCLAFNNRHEFVSASYLFAGFASLTLAMFIRPQGLLLPLALGACLLAIMKGGRIPIVIGVVGSYLVFPLSLMIFRLVGTGEFGLGESAADLGTNLLLRANRILYGSYFEPGQKMTISHFLAVAAAHPLVTLNTFYADAVNLFLNPGSNHVFGFYLKIYNAEDFRFWVGLLDRAGATGVVGQVLREGLPFLVIFATWMIIHVIVLCGMALAGIRAVRRWNITPPWVWLALVAAVVYLATSFASGQVRWAHRTGVEPLLVMLAVWGFFRLGADNPTSPHEEALR